MPSGVFDPTSLTNLSEMDSIGYGCVWLLRAEADCCCAPGPQ